MSKKEVNTRLPRNFHRTFKPERQYINAMLKFAAVGESGDYLRISEKTGIPTGEFSGKVPAIYDYCVGMGLVVDTSRKGPIKQIELSDFGRVVLLEDPYLRTEISQWLCHLSLCNRETGADVWHHVFWDSYYSLGSSFTRDQLENMLRSIYGNTNRGLIGPIISMYNDEASFRTCNALIETEKSIVRKNAPLSDDMALGYGAWLINMMERYFPGQRQISTSELELSTGWLTITGWIGNDMSRMLELFERKNLMRVDRHMNPWLVKPTIPAKIAWQKIFNDLI